MKLTLTLSELDMSAEELKELLAIKLFQDGRVSPGKAPEIAGYRVWRGFFKKRMREDKSVSQARGQARMIFSNNGYSKYWKHILRKR